MKGDETADELRRLRSELDALQRATAQASPADRAPQAAPQWNGEEIEQQLTRVAKQVRDEAQERPLLTLLVVFAFGLLLGRLLR